MSLATLLLLAAAAQGPPGRALSLGGIALGQPEQEVIARLGRPKARTTTEGAFLPVRLDYPGLTVLLDEQGVGGVIATGRRRCTVEGICPGMHYAKAKAVYGQSLETSRSDGATLGFVYEEGCWLRFMARKEKIDSVEMQCSP